MPVYEYTCIVCNEIKSVERSIYDQEIIPDHCSQLMNRVYSPVPVKFNTTGFYSTGG